MNGPEHYVEAERELKRAAGTTLGSDEERYRLATAQVHATLALAAATALGATQISHAGGGFAGMRGRESQAWQETAGVDS